MPIDKFKRYQSNFLIDELYPKRTDGKCRCGCGEQVLPPKRSWLNEKHRNTSYVRYCIIKGITDVIRDELYKRDAGVCAQCETKVMYWSQWDADHIVEVRHGGGGCELDNYQTLCTTCHKVKTKSNYKPPTPEAQMPLL